MTKWTQFCPFLTYTYLYVDIFNPERGQKQKFLDHLPPLLVHVVIECPPVLIFSEGFERADTNWAKLLTIYCFENQL